MGIMTAVRPGQINAPGEIRVSKSNKEMVDHRSSGFLSRNTPVLANSSYRGIRFGSATPAISSNALANDDQLSLVTIPFRDILVRLPETSRRWNPDGWKPLLIATSRVLICLGTDFQIKARQLSVAANIYGRFKNITDRTVGTWMIFIDVQVCRRIPVGTAIRRPGADANYFLLRPGYRPDPRGMCRSRRKAREYFT